MNPKDEERFWTKVEELGTCWVWSAYTDKLGYARFYLDGKKQLAHRVSYSTYVGEIPEGLVIDHLCCNPSCVRPEHLEPVTQAENMRRGSLKPGNYQRKKTHCRNGHKFTPETTYVTPKGHRACIPCNLEAKRRYRERKTQELKEMCV